MESIFVVASCNNRFVLSMLSPRSNSRRTNVIVEGWRLVGGSIMSLFLIWGFCGALVLAKPTSVQRDDHFTTATDLKVELSVDESKASLSRELRDDGFRFQPENDIKAVADLEVKPSAASKGSRNLEVWKDVFELEQDDVDEATPSDRKVNSETARDASGHREALEDLFKLRLESLADKEEETGSSTGKDESFNGERHKRAIGALSKVKMSGGSNSKASPVIKVDRRSRDEEKDRMYDEELVRGSQGGAFTPLQDLKRRGSKGGSHRRLKNDTEVSSTAADPRHNDTSKSKAESSIAAPGFGADALPSSDSDQLSKAKSDEAVAQLPELELEPEEADEGAQEKDLIPEYSLGEPITDWDRERQQWLEDHPEVKPYTDDGRVRLFILTGTQPSPCSSKAGDHLFLRCFKNKVDYCRIHGIDIFYNMGLLQPDMPSFWAKLPVVRATMLSHPEVEWIWWLDADAVITDMEFEIPLEKYEDYNMVVHGWESLIFEKKSWVSLNAGSFLIRNCQWSMEMLERWASMGPQTPLGESYRDILSDGLPDRARNPTDDQAALVYLMNFEKERWAGKIKVELEYFLNGYFVEMIDGFEATEEKYKEMEEKEEELAEMVESGEVRKEKMVAKWGRVREKHMSRKKVGMRERRPFVTHFTGCQPCSGNHNPVYSHEQCHDGMVRALGAADDQVLRTLGYRHPALHLPDILPV